MPNFLIIGAGKSGTSSLYYYLKQHPQVFMSPVKEPNFFAYDPKHKGWNGPVKSLNNSIRTLEDYLKLFENVRDEKAIGEASPSTFGPYACQQVKTYIPHGKFICILRQPVDAAYSAFLHLRREGNEPESDFLKAYRATDYRKKNNWAPFFLYRRTHSRLIEHWIKQFSREQFHFCLTDDLKTDAMRTIKDVFRFLGVDETFEPELSKRNTGYQIRIQTLSRWSTSPASGLPGAVRQLIPAKFRQRLRTKIIAWNQVPIPPLNPQVRNKLTEELRGDIVRIQDLIGRDLKHWLVPR
jgi:hypothetical protein